MFLVVQRFYISPRGQKHTEFAIFPREKLASCMSQKSDIIWHPYVWLLSYSTIYYLCASQIQTFSTYSLCTQSYSIFWVTHKISWLTHIWKGRTCWSFNSKALLKALLCQWFISMLPFLLHAQGLTKVKLSEV